MINDKDDECWEKKVRDKCRTDISLADLYSEIFCRTIKGAGGGYNQDKGSKRGGTPQA